MVAMFRKYYGEKVTEETLMKIMRFRLASGKYAELEALREEMVGANLPLTPANLVFGEGDPDARVLFIGEAPGANEDIERRPFVGRGGKLLNAMLEGIGWERKRVYITNIVKRRPPDNRDPLPEEIAAYRPYLGKQIDIIGPAVIVPLGRFAMNYFLPEAKISRDQGTTFPWNGRLVYPVFHPAAALRNPNAMKEFRASFARLPVVVGGVKK
jgi:DNA polymerase